MLDRRSLFWIFMQHAQEDALCTLTQVVWNLQFALRDVFVQDVDVIVVERRDADKHLIEDYTDLVNVS